MTDDWLADAKGNPISEYTTDKNGVIKVENLPFGNYQFIEKTSPTGYILMKEPIPFSIKENSKTIELVAKNTQAKGFFAQYPTPSAAGRRACRHCGKDHWDFKHQTVALVTVDPSTQQDRPLEPGEHDWHTGPPPEYDNESDSEESEEEDYSDSDQEQSDDYRATQTQFVAAEPPIQTNFISNDGK